MSVPGDRSAPPPCRPTIAGRSRASRTADRSPSSRRTATGAGSARCERPIARRRAALGRASRGCELRAGQRGQRRARQRRAGAPAQPRATAARMPPPTCCRFRSRRRPAPFDEAGAYLGDVVLAAETDRAGGGGARHRARPSPPAPRRARPAASAGLRPRRPTPQAADDGRARDRDAGGARRCRSLRRRIGPDPSRRRHSRPDHCVP